MFSSQGLRFCFWAPCHSVFCRQIVGKAETSQDAAQFEGPFRPGSTGRRRGEWGWSGFSGGRRWRWLCPRWCLSETRGRGENNFKSAKISFRGTARYPSLLIMCWVKCYGGDWSTPNLFLAIFIHSLPELDLGRQLRRKLTKTCLQSIAFAERNWENTCLMIADRIHNDWFLS